MRATSFLHKNSEDDKDNGNDEVRAISKVAQKVRNGERGALIVFSHTDGAQFVNTSISTIWQHNAYDRGAQIPLLSIARHRARCGGKAAEGEKARRRDVGPVDAH